jgi:hypothetical protein
MRLRTKIYRLKEHIEAQSFVLLMAVEQYEAKLS